MPDVTQGLIDFALHPPLGSLKPHLDGQGPYTGNVTRTTWSSTLGPIYTPEPVSNTFGVFWSVNGTIPAGYGYSLGWVAPSGTGEDFFTYRMLQLVVQHQLLSGAWITSQLEDFHTATGFMMWDIALPGRIGLYTAPGISVDLYYLMVN